VIVAADGRATREPADLLPALDEDRIGRDAALRLLRAGEIVEKLVRVAERQAPSNP
jgi:S1-C subfamily serine protease